MPKPIKVLLGYKNFGAYVGISHIGLGVSALNNSKVLNRLGIDTDIAPLKQQDDLSKWLSKDNETYTHVIISAPWISTALWSELAATYPRIKFAMNCHSNVGFLQADANGIKLMREQLGLEAGTHNFHVAANSERMCEFVKEGYGDPCTYLPNLYYLEDSEAVQRQGWHHSGGILRIGIFGATRPLKNILSAVASCLVISQNLKAQTEIWISTGREDSRDVGTIMRSIHSMTDGIPAVTLKYAPWSAWPQFRKLVGSMHLLLQPSYTESFNMVTADGASQGVPSVVSSAITWAPPEWKADIDDVENIARMGIGLIYDPSSGLKGLRALKRHNLRSIANWKEFLGIHS